MHKFRINRPRMKDEKLFLDDFPLQGVLSWELDGSNTVLTLNIQIGHGFPVVPDDDEYDRTLVLKPMWVAIPDG